MMTIEEIFAVHEQQARYRTAIADLEKRIEGCIHR